MKAVIFDRDDTLTVDVGWTYKLEDFKFVNGAPKAVRLLNRSGYLVFVATNQGGIAKGYFNENQMNIFHWKLKYELSKYHAWIDDIAYCPHTPYPPNHDDLCSCRKPNPGLLCYLSYKWKIKPKDMLMFGDKKTDVEAANRVGFDGYLFNGDNLYDFVTSKLGNF